MLDYGALGPAFWRGEAGRQPKLDNISGAAWTGAHLWTAADEGSSIERLESADDGFAGAAQFELAGLFGLRPGREIDMEALGWDEERLWICASHGVQRAQLEAADAAAAGEPLYRSLLEVSSARTILGYVKLNSRAEPKSARALPRRRRKGGLLWAIAKQGGALAEALEPGAQGVDVEGFAAKDMEALVGLRRPVIDGEAMVLRIRLEKRGGGLVIVKDRGRWHEPHTLAMEGLGVRDLLRVGKDALVIAGPEKKADGPYALYRWRDAFAKNPLAAAILEKIASLPVRPNVKPEAMALEDGRLIVIHDGPQQDPARPGVIPADVYDLKL
jgi:hypothetical protein